MKKTCITCGEIKPIEEFYANKQNKDGHAGKCKECVKAYQSRHRESKKVDKPPKPIPKTRKEQEALLKARYEAERIPIDGKICPVCGEWKPASEYRANKYRKDGLWNFCKSCFDERYREKRNKYNRGYEKDDHGKAVKKAWRDNNREKVNAYNRNWQEHNPDAYKAIKQRTWKSRVTRLGRDFINEKHREYLRNNPDKRREYGRRYFSKNKEKVYKWASEWNKRHPEVGRVKSQKRRARLLGNGGTFTAEEWIGICNKYDNKCLCCGHEIKLTVDHVVPISVGGINDISNIQPLCRPCNSRKGTQIVDYRH